MKKSLASLTLLFLVGLLAAFQTVPSPGPGRKLLAGGGSGTFSFLQLTAPSSRTFCNKSVDICTYPVTTFTNGTYVTAGFEDNLDGSQPQRKLLNFYDCATSPCGSGNTINTWTIQHGCEAFEPQTSGGNTVSTSAATAGPITGGANFVTFVRDGHFLSVENYTSMVVELSSTTTATVENVNIKAESALTNHVMTSTSLSGGNNHAVVQFITTGGAPSAITAPYSSHFFGFSPAAHYAAAVAINITDGTAPIWTDAISNDAAGCVVNWKD